MGHSVDPDKELQKLEKTISGMENTLADLIVKAKKCKYVSSIDYVDGDKSKLRMVVEELPEDDQLGKKDGDKFVYRSTTTDFDVPTPRGALTKITCEQKDGKFTLTEMYSSGDPQTYAIEITDNKGPNAQQATDGKDKEYKDKDDGHGNYVEYNSNGSIHKSNSTAGTSISHTGLSASATGLSGGATLLSASLVCTSTSFNGVFTCAQAAANRGAAFESDVDGWRHALLEFGTSLGPLGCLIAVIVGVNGGLKKTEKAVDTNAETEVDN